MRLLLDTHVLLWCLSDPARLSAEVRSAIENRDNEVLVSAATAWELAVKRSLGKVSYPDQLSEAVAAAGFDTLPITFDVAQTVADLPLHHRDPFDRMLIAQAGHHGLTLVTHDSTLMAYGVPVLMT